MAKAKRGVKTQAIRDYIAENPTAGPAAVATALRGKGIRVKVTHVASVKYGDQHSKGKRRGRKQPALRIAARKTSPGTLSVEQLISVKTLADSLGGIDLLRTALDTLEQLR